MVDESSGESGGGVPWQLAPGTEVAGFIIEELLASGSFGTVYRAKRGERPYALKLVSISPRSDREVEALRLMRHPNVVCFHGYGLWPEEEPHFLVLALELVEGRPLDVWALEENPSALQLVLQVLLPLALTLAEVHEAGVVHRDLKEANIVVREADGQPVLVDFGAAGLAEAKRLTTLLPPGTVEYRSPEAWRFARQWEGEPYASKPGDDLWALGIISYWLLTRELPFGDRNNPDMVRRVLEETPPAPHELNPRVPKALGELCMELLEKDPEKRFADAMDFAVALSEEWAQADRSWRAPLFPGGKRDKNPAPAPASEAKPERQPPRRWWIAGLAVATVLGVLGVWLTLLVLRRESPPPSPPQQASPRQEMAPAQMTGEVVHHAGPQKSPTPAPVTTASNSEEPPMPKSKTTRALIAASCVAGSGCASGPQLRPPPPAECPPGAVETFERFNIRIGEVHGVWIPPRGKPAVIAVKPGPIVAEIIGPWGGFRDHTFFSGELFQTKDRVFVRFTEARLPSGESVPVCLEAFRNGDLGLPLDPESTRERPVIIKSVSVQAVKRLQ